MSTIRVAIGLALALCGASVAAQSRNPQAKDPVAAREGRLEAFARELERAITDGDARGYDSRFDVDLLLDRALVGLEAAPAQVAGYRRGFKQSFGFARSIIQQVRKGSYTFLRLREIEGSTRAIFRVLLDNGSVNYQELCLDDRNGRVTVVDVFTAVNGELTSTILRRHFLMTLAAEEGDGLVGKILGRQSDLVRHLPAIRELTDSFKAGRHEHVLEVYATLSPGLQKERIFLAMRVNSAMLCGEENYRKALADYERWIPKDDPSRALMMVDAYLLRGEYDKMVESLVVLTARVGEDGYIEMMKSSAMLEKGDVERAKRFADRAVALEPDMLDVKVVALRCALLRDAHKESAELLYEIESVWQIDTNGVRQLAGFDDFLASSEGKAWDRRQTDFVQPARPVRPSDRPAGPGR